MPRRGLTPLFLVALLVAVLALGAGDFPSFARAQAEPGTVELAQGWKLASALDVAATGADLSEGGYDDSGWHPVRRMPATVLETLQDDGVYPDLYVGTNLRDEVPQDLYRQDWWYRTTFNAPAGHSNYTLQFPGHQLPRRDLAQRPTGRRQQPDRRHVRRPRSQRDPVDPAGRAEHAWRSR